MAIYGKLKGPSSITKINRMIRKQVETARTRERLTELYNRSKYLHTLTHSPSVKKGLRGEVISTRVRAKREFTKTAKKINQTAKKLNLGEKYDITIS